MFAITDSVNFLKPIGSEAQCTNKNTSHTTRVTVRAEADTVPVLSIHVLVYEQASRETIFLAQLALSGHTSNTTSHCRIRYFVQ